jgi:hypothetical protein
MKTSLHERSKDQISNAFKAVAAVALTLMILTATVATAQPSYPPAALLAAKWWQWVLETPAPINPLLDSTGDNAAINQPQANVWFLAGNTGGTTVRNVTIPAGRALFFPIVNVFDAEDGIALPGGAKVFPPLGFDFPVRQPVQVAQGVVSSVIATATGLSCTVDATPVPITAANLELSHPFSFMLPADNVFTVLANVPLPAGIYFPAVDSGYYVLLNPLSPGQHTIHFTGGFSGGFSLDVTYNLTIQ